MKSVFLTAACILLFFTYWARERSIVPKEYAVPFCQIFHDARDRCIYYFQTAYLNKDFEEANRIITPVLKYQPLDFVAVSLDYSLGSEPRSQIEACLYYDLFNGTRQISGSAIEKCSLSKNLEEKRKRFEEFSTLR